MAPQWIWSQTLNQNVCPIVENGRTYYLLERGGRIPAPSQQPQSSIDPRTLPQNNPAGPANPSAAYGQPGPSQYTTTRPQQTTSRTPASCGNTNQSGYSGDNGSGAPGYSNVREAEGRNGVRSRIATGPRGERILLGTEGEQELLDSNYRKRRNSFFKVGKVFMTLWTEPSPGSSTGTSVTSVRFNESVYTQIRRFVVVRENAGYCLAVQITTYGGRGLSKPGVNPAEHALVYTPSRGPYITDSDRGRINIDIVVDPDNAETLDPMSRLNLGKIYTIEHKLKVKPMGMVRNPNNLLQAWSLVFNGGQVNASSSTSTTQSAREARPELNTPIVAVSRQRPRRGSRGSGGSGGSNGESERQMQQLTDARREGRISAEQYQQSMSLASLRAAEIRRERAQRDAEYSEDEDDAYNGR